MNVLELVTRLREALKSLENAIGNTSWPFQTPPTPSQADDLAAMFCAKSDATATALRNLSGALKGLVKEAYPLGVKPTALVEAAARPLRMVYIEALALRVADEVNGIIAAESKPEASPTKLIGRMGMSDIRQNYPNLDKRQIEAIRKRLSRWREKHEDECWRGEDDGLNRNEWLYPASIVEQFVREITEAN